ncbi:hypothetical protein [Planctomyces sp. SH-PL14]|uniref:hypothetical protein n=1 Tax=Planctomyces sp. SH-PL14 TaxID=1632864 RepID=UPI00078D62C4|nr:hypothetical protein [Planctomyces sp. SH-PL14]AMV20633.1 hypothetical protein VT03_22225 [Planctomyces sp. SH-PL14]
MTTSDRLTIVDGALALDGGTILLDVVDRAGAVHQIVLAQNVTPKIELELLPGRLHFDGKPVGVRSTEEASLLNRLKNSDVQLCEELSDDVSDDSNASLSPVIVLGEDLKAWHAKTPGGRLRMLVDTIVERVEAEAYVLFAEKVALAADSTKYTVWPDPDPTTRNRAILQLSRVQKAGVSTARTFLDSGEPLARDISAVAAVEIIETWRAEGLAVRVEPPLKTRAAE